MLVDGFKLTNIELDEGEKIPEDLSKFDGMFCMGGPMDTWMTKQYPWIIEEKNKIKEFIIDLKIFFTAINNPSMKSAINIVLIILLIFIIYHPLTGNMSKKNKKLAVKTTQIKESGRKTFHPNLIS